MAALRTSIRLLAALSATALVIATAGCGDDDDKAEAGPDRGPAASATTTTKEPRTDEGQIRALVARVQQAFTTGDGDVICDSLTATGQRDIVKYGRATGLSGDCAAVARGIVKRDAAEGIEQQPTRVVTVRVRGSRATALIRIANTTTMRQRYRKQDGEWKIGSFHLAAAV